MVSRRTGSSWAIYLYNAGFIRARKHRCRPTGRAAPAKEKREFQKVAVKFSQNEFDALCGYSLISSTLVTVMVLPDMPSASVPVAFTDFPTMPDRS